MAASETVMTAKVFMNGRSQAVRIPAEYRFEEDELFINKMMSGSKGHPESAPSPSGRPMT